MGFKRILDRIFSAKKKAINASGGKNAIKIDEAEGAQKRLNDLVPNFQNANGTQTKYDFGYDHDGDVKKNIKALLQAYDAGVPDAALYLAFTHTASEPANYDAAFKWFEKASHADDWNAMAAHKWLAECYRDGVGCSVDLSKAYFYIEMFAARYDGLQSRWGHNQEPLRLYPENYRTQVYLNMKESLYRNMAPEEFSSAINEIGVEIERLGLELAPLEAYIPNFNWFMEKLEKVLINGEDTETVNEIINESGYKQWEMWMRINNINSLPKSLIYNEE